MRKWHLGFLIIFGALCAYSLVFAQGDIPGRTDRWVNDYAGVIDGGTEEYLERRISNIKQTTPDPAEVIVATFRTLGKWDGKDFVYAYGEKWREAKKGRRDNAVIIILVPEERRVMLGVGRNLQEVIPGKTVSHIINDIMMPYIEKGEYSLGIRKGVDAVIGILDKTKIPMGPHIMIIRLLIAILMIFFIIKMILSSRSAVKRP